ncbi:MAG: zinc ribbon domain-containing protein [Chloroflexota bacterium]
MAEAPLSTEVWDALRSLAFQDGERVAVLAALQESKARATSDTELEAAKARFDLSRRELAAVSTERRAEEARLEDLVLKIKRTEERLASGQLHHEREILAAQGELERLGEAQRRTEAAWLDTTAREESLTALQPEARAALALVESEAATRMAMAAEALRAVEQRMSGIEQARRHAAQLVPPDVRERYRALYNRTGGRPFALAVAGECSNCHASVPAAAVQQLRARTGVPNCVRCGRLLLAG